MPTSRTSSLSKPIGCEVIPLGTFGYFRARNKNRLYQLVLREFVRSGMSRADLARRMNKRPEIVTRLLGAPGNWTLDTVSDLLFAISGAEPTYSLSYPLDEAKRNFNQPDWLTSKSDWMEANQARSLENGFIAQSQGTQSAAQAIASGLVGGTVPGSAFPAVHQ